MEIGNAIKAQRLQLNMTQEELAAAMGYKSKSTINKIEMGVNDIPLSKVSDFARVLHTTPAYLMGWVDENEINHIHVHNHSHNRILDILHTVKEHDKILALIEVWHSLDQESKQQFIDYGHFLMSRKEK